MSKLARIRADAMIKGYVIEYPGCYCDKALIRTLAPSTQQIEIDMRDGVRGLQNLDATVAILPTQKENK